MAGSQFTDYLQGRASIQKYGAGGKIYGPNGATAPNIGPSDPAGYMERDMKAKQLRNAMLKRMKLMQAGKMAAPAANDPMARSY